MQQYAARDSRIMYISAPPKPEGWAGKNWACYEGYLRAKGKLLMFTDADTSIPLLRCRLQWGTSCHRTLTR